MKTEGYPTNDLRKNYPNLDGLTRGMVSGRICEWPMLIVEAAEALKLIDAHRALVREARLLIAAFDGPYEPEGFEDKPVTAAMGRFSKALAAVDAAEKANRT